MKSKAKPYTPYNHCDKCNFNYPHYNSTLTKCPRCEELKNELKKEQNNVDGGRLERNRENVFTSLRNIPKGKGKISSERAGRNLRKLTSEPKPRKPINKVSKKQGKINRELEKVYERIMHDREPYCESCGKTSNLSPSHAIPRSLRKDLELDPTGIFIQCMGMNGCHDAWESLDGFKIIKFKNLEKMVAWVKSKDEGRFIKIQEALSKQLNYSR